MFTLFQPVVCLIPSATWDSAEVILLKIAAIFFLVCLNGLFVASEFAIVKIRPSQLEALIEEKNPRAEKARHITSHLDGLPWLVLGWGGLENHF